jgi:hypothetical protein
MNHFLNRTSRLIPAFITFALVSTLGITGCRPGPCERLMVEDSVKAHIIPLQEAIDYTSRFRATVDTLDSKCPEFARTFKVGHAESFNKYSYDFLLGQKDSLGRPAAGIRIYYGIDSTHTLKLVMVPYDENGNDILHHLASVGEKPAPGATSTQTEALIVNNAQAFEVGQLCPPVCPPSSSPLNEK